MAKRQRRRKDRDGTDSFGKLREMGGAIVSMCR
jgi:hypothetical protein